MVLDDIGVRWLPLPVSLPGERRAWVPVTCSVTQQGSAKSTFVQEVATKLEKVRHVN